MLATSEMKNQPCCDSDLAASEITGSVNVGMGGIDGDWVGCPGQTSAERYCVTPSPSRLMATPETIWSTPKVTVATACTTPPSAPNSVPARSPHHGP